MQASTHPLPDLAATQQLAAALAPVLRGQNLHLAGALGAGKTTFVQALAAALGVTKKIKSPTFTYLRTYPLPGAGQLAHFDFYRLPQDGTPPPPELADALATACADPRTTVAAEWAERLPAEWQAAFFTARMHFGESAAGERVVAVEQLQ